MEMSIAKMLIESNIKLGIDKGWRPVYEMYINKSKGTL